MTKTTTSPSLLTMRPPFIRNEFQRYIIMSMGATLHDLLQDDDLEFKKLLDAFSAGFASGFTLASGMQQMEASGGSGAEAAAAARAELKEEVESLQRMKLRTLIKNGVNNKRDKSATLWAVL